MTHVGVPEEDTVREQAVPAGESLFAHARSVLAGRYPLRVLVLGDSVPWGAGASSYRRAFPSLWREYLRAKHGVPIHLVNHSEPGATTATFQQESRRAARRFQPDLAVIALGINDQLPVIRNRRKPSTWRGSQTRVPLDEFRKRLEIIATGVVRASGADVIVVTPPPVTENNEAYRQVVIDVARTHTLAVADVAAAWRHDADLFQPDGVHPNDHGHAVYATTLSELGL